MRDRLIDEVFSPDAKVGRRKASDHSLHVFFCSRVVSQAALVDAKYRQVILQLLGIPVFQNIYNLFTPNYIVIMYERHTFLKGIYSHIEWEHAE